MKKLLLFTLLALGASQAVAGNAANHVLANYNACLSSCNASCAPVGPRGYSVCTSTCTHNPSTRFTPARGSC